MLSNCLLLNSVSDETVYILVCVFVFVCALQLREEVFNM